MVPTLADPVINITCPWPQCRKVNLFSVRDIFFKTLVYCSNCQQDLLVDDHCRRDEMERLVDRSDFWVVSNKLPENPE